MELCERNWGGAVIENGQYGYGSRKVGGPHRREEQPKPGTSKGKGPVVYARV